VATQVTELGVKGILNFSPLDLDVPSDVVVENVSLVQNYRTQFNDILASDTPEKLLETLRKKVKAQ